MNDRYTEMLANIELMDNCRLLYFTKINIFPPFNFIYVHTAHTIVLLFTFTHTILT